MDEASEGLEMQPGPIGDGPIEDGPLGNGLLEDAPLGPWEQVLQIAEAGGPVVLILSAMSVLALAVVLLKFYQFSVTGARERRGAREAVALFRGGRPGEALIRAQSARGVAAAVVALALRGRLRGSLPDAMVREEALRAAGDHLETLRSHLRILEVIASLAPLLGLFGTVLGMIEAFQQLEAAGAQVNPSVLSGGIWEALLTTAVGLAVAIPTVALLNVFERTVDRLAHDLESLVSQLFTEDLSETSSTTRALDPTADARASFQPAPSPAGQ